MSLPRPQKIVRIVHQVREADKSLTFSNADSGPIGGSSGNLFLVGLPGSGRRALADAVSGALGLTRVQAATALELRRVLEDSGQAVAVMDHELLADPDLTAAVRASGKVFYLMSVAPILAKSLGDLSRLEELAALVERMEPHFLRAAHFILPLASSREEMLADVLEKARL